MKPIQLGKAPLIWISIALLGCLVLASAINLFGQANTTASLQGTVIDKSQAVLRGAEVTTTSKDTHDSRTVKTNDIGEYRFDDLKPGIYNVTATAQGFSKAEAKEVQVLIGRSTRDRKSVV